MKQLIRHLWENNRDEIIAKSRLHCHAFGVHSIMLLESPGKTIRLFITEKNHELSQNNRLLFNQGVPLSLGFHAHHCNLTLEVVRGSILNWLVKSAPGEGELRVKRFEYQSALRGEKPGFKFRGLSSLTTVDTQALYQGDSVTMPADQLHTVWVPADQQMAWLVYEGQEDPNYEAITYSNLDLQDASFDHLYQPADAQVVYHLLCTAGFF